jgi:hypothetical protein
MISEIEYDSMWATAFAISLFLILFNETEHYSFGVIILLIIFLRGGKIDTLRSRTIHRYFYPGWLSLWIEDRCSFSGSGYGTFPRSDLSRYRVSTR